MKGELYYNMGDMFENYRKLTNTTTVLLMYLLLNGYDAKNIEYTVTQTEEKQNPKLIKVYAITKDFVNISLIQKEIENIQAPRICSLASYNNYSTEPIIHFYEKDKASENRLWINDLDIISKIMIISEDAVVSSKLAKPLEDCKHRGFMYFYDYVMKDACLIGKWHIQYSNSDRIFSVYYSDNPTSKEETLLYSVIEIDKSSTYKMVIYIIRKASEVIDQWFPDNFNEQTYERIENQ